MASRSARLIGALALLTLAAAACSDDSSGAPGSTSPGTSTPATTSPVTTAPATTSPATSTPGGLPVVTFEVSGVETFRVELATPELVDHARRLLAGESIANIPIGTVVRDDPGVNAPWSWHIDPATFEFAFATTEVCDGIPSFVEDGSVTSDEYCPWSATVIAVDG